MLWGTASIFAKNGGFLPDIFGDKKFGGKIKSA
jgi:hypothetical protein